MKLKPCPFCGSEPTYGRLLLGIYRKDILIEECAELIQAVEKSRRGILAEDKPAYTYDMIPKMADVLIMLWQFESVMSKHSRQYYEDEICRKLRRQIERIENEVR